MTLENLLRIGRLKEYAADPAQIQQLMDAARRSLRDSGVGDIGPESRFDLAYKAIMQTALAALMANGYRPASSAPGHHMTVLQSLPLTVGTPKERMVVLDALRRKRNLLDYAGKAIDKGSAERCRQEAEQLLVDVEEWLEGRPHSQ